MYPLKNTSLKRAMTPIRDVSGCVTGWAVQVKVPDTTGLTPIVDRDSPLTAWVDATDCVKLWTINIGEQVAP